METRRLQLIYLKRAGGAPATASGWITDARARPPPAPRASFIHPRALLERPQLVFSMLIEAFSSPSVSSGGVLPGGGASIFDYPPKRTEAEKTNRSVSADPNHTQSEVTVIKPTLARLMSPS